MKIGSNRTNIAILIPTFNSAGMLEGTLRSILALEADLDRYIDFVMLCDDGFTDQTIVLAERIWTAAGNVPLIVRRSQQNRGEYRNVNSGIAAMPPHIAWVLVMHSDNEALPQWIHVLASECRRADAGVASICGSWMYVVDGTIVDAGDQRGTDYVEDVVGGPTTIRSSILKGCWWHNGACAVSVEAWKDVGGHPEDPLLNSLAVMGFRQPIGLSRKLRVKGDWDTMLRMLSCGYTIRYVGTPLIRYIENGASVSSGSFSWHGDLLETLQVMRRHQAALNFSNIAWMHWRVVATLSRRFCGSMFRRHWRRAWLAVTAVPTALTSFLVSSVLFFRGTGGKLERIPFKH